MKKHSCYFVASLKSNPELKKKYKRTIDFLNEEGYSVTTDVNSMEFEELEDLNDSEIKKYYKKIRSNIKNSDIFVADITKSSSAVGYQIGFAVANSKSILLLRDENTNTGLGAPFRGNSSKYVHIATYSKNNIENEIKKFLRKVEKGLLVKRLTLQFTKEQVDFVEYYRIRSPHKLTFNSALREMIDLVMDQDTTFRESNPFV